MKQSLITASGIVLLLSLAYANYTFAFDDEICPAILLNEHGEIEEDYILVCTGLQKAVAFLNRHGVPIRQSIKVMVYDTELENHGNHIGIYNPESERVDILSYARARRLCKTITPFDMSMNSALYESFAAHEFAHAIAEQNFSYDSHSYVVQEYIAYVVQLATMDATLRDKIMERYSVPAFESFDDVSLIYYQLDPNAFGVKSYRHFMQQEEPAVFINKLLTGEIRASNSQSEWW